MGRIRACRPAAIALAGSLCVLGAVAPAIDRLFDRGHRASPAFLLAGHADTTCPTTPAAPPPGDAFRLDAADQPMVHAAVLTPLPGCAIGAYWYGGSREGGRDVTIYHARYDGTAWSQPQIVMTRERVAQDLGRQIRKLGNPSAYLDGAGRVWLFFVSVSVGGWAGSAINVAISEDGGAGFGPVRRLVTSPFFNLSTLVRGPAVALQGGPLLLPVYHEFLGKFPEILTLDASGQVRGKTRLAWGRGALQPVLVPVSAQRGVVFARNAGAQPRHILFAETHDGGRHFSPLQALNLPNPDSAVAAARLEGDTILLAYNHAARGRGVLALARVAAGSAEAVRLQDLERSAPEAGRRFAYPALLHEPGGRWHLVYTADRERIRHRLLDAAQFLATPEP